MAAEVEGWLKSKTMWFKSYCAYTHTHRTNCSTWTTKVVGKSQFSETGTQTRNSAKPYSHGISVCFSRRSLAKEQHQQIASDSSHSENDEQQSPWLSRNIRLIRKQEIHNEIAKQQANKTSTAANTFTTPNIYNTETSLNFAKSKSGHQPQK